MTNAIVLTVNGERRAAEVEPRTSLADVLREHLNLTGTHVRCEQGACGACTVLIDGQPARSCITFAVQCDRADVTTIEGLDDDEVAMALRRAFSAEHGLQCGFCTPAMLITARDVLTRVRDLDAERVRNELGGNLCRCTGYAGIVRAVLRAASELGAGARPAIEQRNRLGPVGARPFGTRPPDAPIPDGDLDRERAPAPERARRT